MERAWQELRCTAAQQETPTTGRSQTQIAVSLAQDSAGQFAYDLGHQAWMAYDHGRWKPHETERITQRIGCYTPAWCKSSIPPCHHRRCGA